MVIAVVVCQWSLEKCCTKSHGKTAIVVFKIELFQRIHSSLGTPDTFSLVPRLRCDEKTTIPKNFDYYEKQENNDEC